MNADSCLIASALASVAKTRSARTRWGISTALRRLVRFELEFTPRSSASSWSCAPRTVTVKEMGTDSLPAGSVARHLTVVIFDSAPGPSGNTEAAAGRQAMVRLVKAVSGSVATRLKLTDAPFADVAFTLIADGSSRVGAV